jgi:hypothetical protein
MTSNLAISLLRRGSTGDEILQILETLVDGIEQENIADAAAHFEAIQF